MRPAAIPGIGCFAVLAGMSLDSVINGRRRLRCSKQASATTGAALCVDGGVVRFLA